ncbi:MAG TPA: transketolase C-terminal domain-containing protein [Acidimicrobiales bacterium]|nr:transketolase C-terminal domain-containing protein [Acidimicrobiales bacterium]
MTIVAYGPTVATALEAADLRSLAPLDLDAVVESVQKTGRLVVVHEAPRTLGVAAEVTAAVQERAFYHLESPILRVTGFDTPYPPARLEDGWLPGVDRVLDAVEEAWSH